MEHDASPVRHRIEITGSLSRQAIETIYLELRQLAKNCGAEIEEFRIARAVKEPVSAEGDREDAG